MALAAARFPDDFTVQLFDLGTKKGKDLRSLGDAWSYRIDLETRAAPDIVSVQHAKYAFGSCFCCPPWNLQVGHRIGREEMPGNFGDTSCPSGRALTPS